TTVESDRHLQLQILASTQPESQKLARCPECPLRLTYGRSFSGYFASSMGEVQETPYQDIQDRAVGPAQGTPSCPPAHKHPLEDSIPVLPCTRIGPRRR